MLKGVHNFTLASFTFIFFCSSVSLTAFWVVVLLLLLLLSSVSLQRIDLSICVCDCMYGGLDVSFRQISSAKRGTHRVRAWQTLYSLSFSLALVLFLCFAPFLQRMTDDNHSFITATFTNTTVAVLHRKKYRSSSLSMEARSMSLSLSPTLIM